MLKKHIGAGVLALGLLFSVGFIAAPAEASSLTSAQISAILSLLQSFGANQSVVNNVSAALEGQTTTNTLSCSSFANLSYGNFDTSLGGPVSQLQTWLGISSNSFGFGTYGPKTQAAWNAKCGGTQTTTQTNPVNFSAAPTSGAAPLTVNFTVTPPTSPNPNESIEFGDHSEPQYGVYSYCSSLFKNKACVQSYTYTKAGTYTASLDIINCTDGGYCDNVGPAIGSVTITVK